MRCMIKRMMMSMRMLYDSDDGGVDGGGKIIT